MSWQVDRANLVCGLMAWLGILQFAASTYYAISIYPDGYSLAENFLSDLGSTRTLDGKDNATCACIFNRSIIALGVAVIPFYVVMPRVITDGGAMLRASAVLSAIGLIGLGLTPCDRYFLAHHVALVFWIGPTLLTVVTFFISAKLDGISSIVLLIGTLLVVWAVLAYAFAGNHNGHVVWQKVLVILVCVWFLLVFLVVSVSTIKKSISPRRLIVEEQARHYLELFERSPRRR